MIILLLCLAFIIAGLAWRASRVSIRHRWRRRQARIMCEALCGRDRSQPLSLIYARLRAMGALASQELVLERSDCRGYCVVRNRRHTRDGGIDGQVIIGGRVWLIQAKRFDSAIRPEHVRAYDALCAARGASGLFIHTGRTGAGSREAVALGDPVEIVSGQRFFVFGHRRSARHRRTAAVKPKSLSIYAALLAIMVSPSIAQARGKGAVAEERLIADCIHLSARGKPWLAKALRALRDQEGGWIGAQVRNRNGSRDLGPLQINSWWAPRFAKLLGRSPVSVQQWLRQDACFNVEAARYILLNELDRSGDIWRAVARYHSPVSWRQREYVAAISARLNAGVHPNGWKARTQVTVNRVQIESPQRTREGI